MRQHPPIARAKPEVLVTWFRIDTRNWTIVTGCPECEYLVGHCLWDVFPHLEDECRPYHERARDTRKAVEFVASDQGHTYLCSATPTLIDEHHVAVINIDLEHLTGALRRFEDDDASPEIVRTRPLLRALS